MIMASKSKFQISKSLDEKIKKFIACPEECETEIAQSASAFILGFNYSNVTNYVGLTTNYELHNSGHPVTGLVFFKSSPNKEEIKTTLQPVRDYFSSSSSGIGNHAKTDKNEALFLIYYRDEETKEANRKIFDLNSGDFLQEQPKLSVLDDVKIYNHSAIVKLTASIKLELFQDNGRLQSREKVASVIDDAKKFLSNDAKNLSIQLIGSNYSTKSPLEDKNPLESLYSHLDVPHDLEQMGDYLPQMTKEDKAKMLAKWRNKVKDQRLPLEIELTQQDLRCEPDDLPAKFYRLQLEEFTYLHVNDSISKSTRLLLFLLRVKLDLLKHTLLKHSGDLLEADEIKSCCFKPAHVNHLLQAIYLIPTKPDYESLQGLRRDLHQAYLLPLSKPVLRYSQRITGVNLTYNDEKNGYLCNVHSEIVEKSGIKGGARNIVCGTYTYHHYLQDRIQDNGWGCAYRSLQTIISWFKHQGYIYSPDVPLRAPKLADGGSSDNNKISALRDKLNKECRVPTHEEIQTVLVDVGDKQPSFIGSQKWIGSQEVCYVLSHLYNLESKFISVSSGSELVYKARDLGQHFATQWTPIMIGGGVLAHTIIGTDFNEKNGDISYLILDPHYTGGEDLATITKKGWCGWKKNAFWDKSAFYNLCLPQRPEEF